jgi:hypothetical protein
MAHLTNPCTMKKSICHGYTVLPETARFTYPGRVISGVVDKPVKARIGAKRVISGLWLIIFSGALMFGFYFEVITFLWSKRITENMPECWQCITPCLPKKID